MTVLYAELAFLVSHNSYILDLKQCTALRGNKLHNIFCFSCEVKGGSLTCKRSNLKRDFVNASDAPAIKHKKSLLSHTNDLEINSKI